MQRAEYSCAPQVAFRARRRAYGAAIVKLRDCGGEDLPALLVAVKSTV